MVGPVLRIAGFWKCSPSIMLMFAWTSLRDPPEESSKQPRPSQTSSKVTDSFGPASYRGPKRRTLKTAEKQPKKVPGGPRAKCRENSRKAAGKTPEACKTAVFRLFGCPSGCFSGCFPGTLPGGHSAPFRLFSRSGVRGLCSWPGRS